MKNNEDLLGRRVAVTGATGMIGSHLVAQLVKSGYKDILLPVRNPAKLDNIKRTFRLMEVEFPQSGIRLEKVDLTDTQSLTTIIEGVDTVFHCAAMIMTGDMTPEQLIENNISVARSVADSSLAAGVKKIIQTSSIIVHSPKGFGNMVNEENPPHAEEESTPYAKSKYYSDLEFRRVADEGIDVVFACPAVVLGEGDWSSNGSSAMIPLIASGIPLYVKGVMAYVDVRDVARALVALDASKEAVGQNFIISSANLSYKELITMGAKAVGKPKPFIKVGKGAVYCGYGVIKAVTFLHLMKDRSLTKSNLDSVLYGNSYDGSKILKFCDFEYTPMEITINRVVRNYLNKETK